MCVRACVCARVCVCACVRACVRVRGISPSIKIGTHIDFTCTIYHIKIAPIKIA